MDFYIVTIIILPLIGFAINGIFGKKINNEKISGIIGTSTVGIGFIISVSLLFNMISLPVEKRSIMVHVADWISAGKFNVGLNYQLDQLSIVFLLVITGVGTLIHIYSIGYMHGDKGFARFFAYLNLFIFMMLNLVLADNLAVTFLGWEGVGLCSFLLIGFWYDQKFEGVGIKTTGDAAKKAFIVNRIGDLGMLIAMFILYNEFGTLKYQELITIVSNGGFSPGQSSALTYATLSLLLGACGKSAQIPLGVWLPDAMAGPTPVSALIHAATMVTSGIFLVSRTSVLFALSPFTMSVMTGIAITTALSAATIGLVQNDIKKVLAYSTVSQLGFMFVALGVGSFSAAVFHVLTHAFFKALLFLGSGSVIHGMHHEQDMRKMGGLKKYMPQTYKTYLIGAIAIAGIPPLSGFFSKDEILFKAWVNGSWVLWIVAAVAAFMTAFYMFRSVYMTFDGNENFDHHHVHPHESPKTMTIPLWILALLSATAGLLGIPAIIGNFNFVNVLHHWLEPVFDPAEKFLNTVHEQHSLEMILIIISTVIATCGIMLARTFYLKKTELPQKISIQFNGIYKLLLNKWYVDEIYNNFILKPIQFISDKFLYNVIDRKLIDGSINGGSRLIAGFSGIFRQIQTGVVQHYATLFIAGVVVILGWIVFFFKY